MGAGADPSGGGDLRLCRLPIIQATGSAAHLTCSASPGILKPVNTPSELKYTASHEWVKIEGDIATVGITDHAQSELGDVVFVELPEAGLAVSESDRFGTVESVKTVSDLYAPLNGEVVEVNPALGAQPELINSEPYGSGWLVKIKLSGSADTSSLLSAEAYEATLD
jgi:glycine cleavage system H protein